MSVTTPPVPHTHAEAGADVGSSYSSGRDGAGGSRGRGRAGGRPTAGAPRWRLPGLRQQTVPHTRLPAAQQLLSRFELGHQLGRGNFGTVYRATEHNTGHHWAIKVVPKSGNKLKMLLLGREIQVLKLVQHPNVVYLREIFETPENVYLILELCERGELATFSRARGKISEMEARAIISGVANGIHYLHRHGIVHRDLKLENVLLAASPDKGPNNLVAPTAKLSDFGLAEVKDKRDHDHMMELFCGTPYCMAPEILSERAYSQQCDVWSMGVILYTLVAGKSPFTGGNEREVLSSIYKQPNLLEQDALQAMTPPLRDLLSRMLHLDPAYRITAAEVVAHPWISGDETQASASQDILTLMKEWRMEMSSEDVSVPDSESSSSAAAGIPQVEAVALAEQQLPRSSVASSYAATAPKSCGGVKQVVGTQHSGKLVTRPQRNATTSASVSQAKAGPALVTELNQRSPSSLSDSMRSWSVSSRMSPSEPDRHMSWKRPRHVGGAVRARAKTTTSTANIQTARNKDAENVQQLHTRDSSSMKSLVTPATIPQTKTITTYSSPHTSHAVPTFPRGSTTPAVISAHRSRAPLSAPPSRNGRQTPPTTPRSEGTSTSYHALYISRTGKTRSTQVPPIHAANRRGTSHTATPAEGTRPKHRTSRTKESGSVNS